MRWSNWLGNQTANPAEIATPRSVDEVASVVARARRDRRHVRMVGAGGSWSPLVPTDGVLLSMRGLSGIRSIDRARCRVTVEAGALLDDVVRKAALAGMSVKSPSMYLGLSVGGLIATGSHGTGRDAATFGDAAVHLELVTAAGELLDVHAGTDTWRAAITNLGALGVVTAVTLQCEPLYNVLESHVSVPVTDVASLIPRMLRDFELVSLFWYPGSRSALFKLGNRTTLPAEVIENRIDPSPAERAVGWFGRFVPVIVRRVPQLREVVGSLVNAGVGVGTRVVSEPYFSHYQQVYPAVISTEHAIPEELAGDAWAWLTERLGQYARAGVAPVNLTAHARFGRGSDAYLASAGGRRTCHLEILSFDGNRQRDLFQPEFHEKMSTTFEGRPHWGKDLVNPFQVARCYGDRIDAFLDVRGALDPDQVFLNPFLRDEVFGLGRRVARGKRASVRPEGERPRSEPAPAGAEPPRR